MVIGTARSERHLHVSADRFCRWLRSNYKLSPVADGLLGRNELKLKLRRKARKARLLGSVGAPVDANADDGIRTGWVCVNVGAVPHAAQGELDDGSAVGFVGFGRLTQDVRLVVQMVTEEKREEIDLEGLWAGALNRKAKQGTRGPGDGDRNLQIAAVEADGDVYLDQNRTRALKSHLQDLKARARASAMEMLGTGGDDYSSTNFLFRFYQAIPPFPTHEHWLCRLELYRYGLELGHPGYAKDGLLGLLDEMQLSGAGVPESTFNDVLVAILKRPADSSGVSGLGSLGRADFALAVSVLEAMRRYGFEAMTEDNIIRLHTAIAPLESPLGDSDLMPPPGSPSDRSRPGTSLPPEMLERTRELQARVNRALISDSDLPCPSTPTLIKLMSLHARTENWPGFYDIFSVPARSMLPRQSALYAHMFETVAGTKHEGRCADALRTWAPEMEREVPEVELEGPVAHAVELCLKVVDKTPDAENEWNRLRQKIARARVEGRTLRNDDFLAHQQRDHVELDEERRLAPEDLFGREQALFEYQAEGRAREEDARHQVRVGA
ncbi:MAG: hypothetical protein M1832_005396 [Thelocarpon impressellum]|nr:MAG: hypothetical protein M1832_005396 [Thelocarpon impressellum]